MFGGWKDSFTGILIASYFLFCLVVFGYSGGDGTAGNPYQISTAEDLNDIGNHSNDWDKHFRLMADIDMSGIDSNEFNVIGTKYNRFAGVFEGNGYTINNFTYHDASRDYVGVFGSTDSDGQIRNLNLYNVIIEGKHYVGGIVGLNYGTVENCLVTGTVSGGNNVGGLVGMNQRGSILRDSHCDINILTSSYADQVGGLIGYNYEGDVINCYSSGKVLGGVESCMIGGLAGFNRGRIRQCYSTADVEGGFIIGGLIGEHDHYELVACYATGDVSGENRCGGLIGRNYWRVSYCYARGAVEGTEYYSGGLIGQNNWDMAVIKHCYSSGSVTSVNGYGGLIGIGDEDNYYINSFWDINTSGQTVSYGGTGLSTSDLQNEQVLISYGWDFAGETENGCNDEWAIPDSGGYPILWYQKSSPPPLPTFAGGSGTVEDPYLIADANDLRSIGHKQELMDKHFKIVNDIDLNDLTYFSIADSDIPFTGIIDGNHHTISNLTYTSEHASGVGMIANLGVGGVIKNLGLTGINIDAGANSEYVGGLVGYNEGGIIQQCYVSGAVRGSSEVALLVGLNSEGEIANCYAVGDVRGVVNIGGLIGSDRYGNVSNCYAAAKIYDAWSASGVFVGQTAYSTYQSCFLHNGLNAAVSKNKDSSNDGILGLSELQMLSDDSFISAGWDFIGEVDNGTEEIWKMPSYGFPVFSWQSASVIPNIEGLAFEAAVETLNAQGLNTCLKLRGYSNTVSEGSVIQTIPPHGLEVSDSLPVYLVVSAGDCPYDGGIGIKENPCQISTVEQLQTLGATVADYELHFILTDDIDLSGNVFSSAVIAPDNDTINSFQGTPFTGSFQGNGHVLKGLTINSSDSYLGLFGKIGCNGLISNLNMENVSVSGSSTSNYLAALAGFVQFGYIENCKVSVSISGHDYAGGLIGQNKLGIVTSTRAEVAINCTGADIGGLIGYHQGNIDQSSASGNIKGNILIGGLCGNILGYTYDHSLANSFSTVTIEGNDYLGGLCGKNSGNISRCYSTGSILGDSYWIGGLCGQCYRGLIGYCFWDTESSGLSVGYHQDHTYPGIIIDVTGLTHVQMQQANSYIGAGWDFVGETANGPNDIWTINEGQDYPQHVWSLVNYVGWYEVDMFDFAYFANFWGDMNCTDSNNCGGTDLDFSGIVDNEDLKIFFDHWLEGVE